MEDKKKNVSANTNVEAPENNVNGGEKNAKNGGIRRLTKKTNLIIFVAVAVAVFVLVNLLAQFIPNIDNTVGGIFTLTETTIKVLNSLEKDVTIYALYDRVEGEAETGPGKRAEQVAILDLYDQFPRVTVSYIDLDRNPSFLPNTVGETAAENYSKNDFIVKCGNNVRQVTSKDIYATQTQTYNYFYEYELTVGIQAETKFTSAIIKVTGDTPVIYFSTGFGEDAKKNYSTILGYVTDSGYDIADIDLRTTDIPEDAACILFMGPKSDLTGAAMDRLDRWLKKGHCAFFFMDIKSLSTDAIVYDPFTNFGEVLSNYGISLERTIVEESGDRAISGTGGDTVFSADTSKAGSLENLDKVTVYMLNARSLNLDNNQTTSEAEAIIKTTKNAKAKSVDNENDTRTGVSVVAASGKSYMGTATSSIVVFGSCASFSNTFLQYAGTSSAKSIMSTSMRWMKLETKTNVADSIEAKEYNNAVKSAIMISDNEMNVTTVIVMIVIPLLILIAGFVIWLRRRHL